MPAGDALRGVDDGVSQAGPAVAVVDDIVAAAAFGFAVCVAIDGS